MGKFISNLFLGVLALGLSIFTGSRTLDLLAWALPASQAVYQWLGLAAFEGGMYFWSFYFVSGAKGTPQRSISLVMAIFSVVAVCIATVADLSLDAAQAGKVAALPASAQQAMIIFVGVTVALNVAAFLATKLMSIEKLREIAEGQAEDQIYSAGLRAIVAVAPTIASAAAPHMAQEWANRTWDKLVPGMQGRTEFLSLQQPAQQPALPAAQPAQAPAQVVPSQAAKPRKLLGFIPLGKPAQPVAASFAQTGTLPAQPAQAPAQAQQPANSQGNTGRPVAQPARPAARPRRHHKPAHRAGGSAAQATTFRGPAGSQPSSKP